MDCSHDSSAVTFNPSVKVIVISVRSYYYYHCVHSLVLVLITRYQNHVKQRERERVRDSQSERRSGFERERVCERERELERVCEREGETA